MKESPQSINLYYNIPPSDKVYKAELIEAPEGGWTVNGWNGRRGNTLLQQNKCEGQNFGVALEIYTKLVKSKLAKGYKIGDGEGGTGKVPDYVAPTTKEMVNWYNPQLLNEISEDSAISLIIDPDFCEQEKENGKRIGVAKLKNGDIETVNKKTIKVGASKKVLDAVNSLPGYFEMDGEMIGERYKVFDITSLNGKDLRKLSYKERYDLLVALVKGSKVITVSKTAFTMDEKQLLFKWLRDNNREGAVFKRVSAKHTAGRPASGGDQFKCKFWVTCACRVVAHNQKRSVVLAMLDGNKEVNVGNVTISPDKDIPPLNTIIEVCYLYIVAKGGSLYQPQYLFLKDDQDEPDDVSILKVNSKED